MGNGCPKNLIFSTSLITFLMYSPMYLTVGFGGPELIINHKGVSAVVGTTAGCTFVLVANYAPSSIPMTIAFSKMGAGMAIAWDLMVAMLFLQGAAWTSMLPMYIDLTLVALFLYGASGAVNNSPNNAIPYLAVATLLVVPIVIYMMGIAYSINQSTKVLYDRETGDMFIKKPEPVDAAAHDDAGEGNGGITICTTRPPKTEPEVPLTPNPPQVEFFEKTRHVFVIPNYTEDMEVLARTLGVLAGHVNSKRRYGVYMAMEGAEERHMEKYHQLHARFQDRFAWMGYNVHHLVPGELAGKGANMNSAARALLQEWDWAQEDTMMSVLDADTLLPQEYILYVDWVWASDPEAAAHNLLCPMTPIMDNLEEVPLFVRQWELTFFTTVAGQCTLPGDPRFPLATYTMRLTICEAIDYWMVGPVGIGEDQMTSLRVHCRFHEKRLKPTLVVIKVPYWCSTVTTWGSKWRQQIRHYLSVQITWYVMVRTRELPLGTRLYTWFRSISPFLVTAEVPTMLLAMNLMTGVLAGSPLQYWSLGLSVVGTSGVLSMLAVILNQLRIWGMCENGNAYAHMRFCSLLESVLLAPCSFFCQLLCNFHAKTWLVLVEAGFTTLVYQGVRGSDKEKELDNVQGTVATDAALEVL
jgi:hypothetical protein